MDTPIMFGAPDTLPTGTTTEYSRSVNGGVLWAATERYSVIPVDATLKELRIKLSSALSSGSYTFTLRKNALDTDLTCQITVQECSDLINTAVFAPGDLISMKVVSANPDTAKSAYFTMMATTEDNKSFFTFTTPSTAAAIYLSMSGDANIDSTEQDTQIPVPTNGTLKNLYVKVSAAPSEGKSYTYTIRKALANTSLTCTIANTDTSCSDLSNSVSLSPGDLINISITTSGTPSGVYHYFGIEFDPTINGESVQLFSDDDDPADSEFNNLNCIYNVSAWTATEATVQELASEATYKKLYVKLDTAPSAGDSRTFTLSVNGVPSILTCTISETDTTCNDTSNEVSVSDGDLLATKHTLTGTPAANNGLGISYVTYISAGAAEATRNRVMIIN